MYDKYGWQRLATEAPSPRFRSPLIRPWHKGIPLYSTFALLLPHLWSHFGKYIAVPVSLLGWAETLGLSLNSGKVAGSQLWSNEYVTDKETIRNYFSKIEGRPSILKKNWKYRTIFGPKTLWIWPKFFPHLPHLYKIYILQKYWSKTTNPALSSGLKKTLPRKSGHHRQLDDQDKEPKIDRKII